MSRLFIVALLLSSALPAQDLDPLIVRILPDDDTRLRGRGLPILFRGMRPVSFEQLQQWMRVVAAPDQVANQDRDVPPVAPPSAAFPRGRRASNRTLLIRCHPYQDVAWVQAVALAAWLLPGDGTREEKIGNSPLLLDTRIGLLDKNTRTPVRVLRSFRPGPDGTLPNVEDLLLRVFPRASWPKDLLPEVMVQLGAYADSPVGKCTGYRLHRSNADAASFDYQPKLFPFRLREQLSGLRKKDPKTQVRVKADARVPYVLVHEILQIVHANELTVMFDTDLGLSALRALAKRGTTGTAIAPAPVVVGPTSDQPDQGPIDGDAVEFALERSLQWLMRHQGEDGRWDSDGFPGAGKDGMLRGMGMHDVGVTGMAVLAFLEAGHSPTAKGPYQGALKAGLKWLESQQDAEGGLSPRGDPSFVYNHGIAAEALARTCAVTTSDEWKNSAQLAINFILKAQNPYRGWRYGVRPGDNDSSVTSWMLAALAAGKEAGLDVPRNNIQWAVEFLDELTDKDTGRTGYTRTGERPVRTEDRLDRFPGDASEALTAMGMWCRLTHVPDSRNHVATRLGRALLGKTLPTWAPDGSIDMIYWFWGTRTLKLLGGDAYEAWRRSLARALIAHQRTEGAHAGGFRPAGAWGSDGGAVYSTAIMARALTMLR